MSERVMLSEEEIETLWSKMLDGAGFSVMGFAQETAALQLSRVIAALREEAAAKQEVISKSTRPRDEWYATEGAADALEDFADRLEREQRERRG